MVGFRAPKEFKDFLQKIADEENRTLSNFVMNALMSYIKEHHGIDWRQEIKKRPDN